MIKFSFLVIFEFRTNRAGQVMTKKKGVVRDEAKKDQSFTELNVREIFDTPAGQFYKDKLKLLGLEDRMMGGNRWWGCWDHVEMFRRYSSIGTDENGDSYMELTSLSGEKFLVDAAFVAKVTRLTANPNRDDDVMNEFLECQIMKKGVLTPLSKEVTPYHAAVMCPQNNTG